LRARSSDQTSTSRSGSAYGSGRSSTALTTLKMAVQAPMPSAIVTIATAAKPRFLRSPRRVYIRSLNSVSIVNSQL
jgi:hypothetical protein